MSREYVMEWERDIDYVEHLDGVDWHEAPKPRRLHPHWAQTRGIVYGHYIERCACGAYGPRPWLRRLR